MERMTSPSRSTLTTFSPRRKPTPMRSSASCVARVTRLSFPGSTEGISSTTVTSDPNAAYAHANSRPMTPPPMSRMRAGISRSATASSEVHTPCMS